MNYFNIQKAILKNAENKFKTGKSINFYYLEKENHVFISQGYFIQVIPKSSCIIDFKKAGVNDGSFMDKIFDNEPKYTAVKTNSIVFEESKNSNLYVFKIPQKDNECVYIDKKYLDDFEKKMNKWDSIDLIFKCDGYKSPLFIYRADDELPLGLILPVNRGKHNNMEG